ncbi:MAG: D-alanyl-D-alanine carboxypeptidase [Clostridia bacterium]|nr:D-alanyl-D-alanine carboxypeptidase [Clostridia bacterium]
MADFKSLHNRIAAALLALLLAVVPVLSVGSALAEASESQDSGGQTSDVAKNTAIVYCVDTEQVLYEKDSDRILAPGPVTKIMSAMIAYDVMKENKKLMSEIVNIQSSWLKNCYTPGDRSTPYLGIAAGENYTLEYLFATTLVANANDACAVLVRYCADSFLGGEAGFLDLMNQRAQELGMTSTHFYSTTGFNGSSSFTTARDVMKLAAAFYRYNDLVELSDSFSYQRIRNKNYLICDKQVSGYLYVGAVGLIAGQSSNEGNYSVLTYYEKDGLTYAFAVMGAPGEHIDADGTHWFDDNNAYADIHRLIPWTLESYKFVTLCSETQIMAELRVGRESDNDHLIVVPDRTVERLMMNPDREAMQTEIVFRSERVFDTDFNGSTVKTIEAPVEAGEELGTATFYLNGEAIAEVALVARDAVKTNALLSGLNSIRDFLFGSEAMRKITTAVLILIGVWAVLALTVFIIRTVLRRRQKKRRAALTAGKNGNKPANMNKL